MGHCTVLLLNLTQHSLSCQNKNNTSITGNLFLFFNPVSENLHTSAYNLPVLVLPPLLIVSRDYTQSQISEANAIWTTSRGVFTDANLNAHQSVNAQIQIECALQV